MTVSDGSTFAVRLAIAGGFLLLVSAVELALRGRRATRWQSTLFLLCAAVFGAG